MNKILFFLIVFPCLTIANPYKGVEFYVSEFQISDNGYTIELMYRVYEGISKFDSICLTTKTSEHWFYNVPIENKGVYVYTRDSFPESFALNPKGDWIFASACYTVVQDSIKTSYSASYKPLYFGDIENTDIPNFPDTSYSIAYFEDFYFYFYGKYGYVALDNSPSFGVRNDTVGTIGKLSGYMFDSKGKITKNQAFTLGPFRTQTNEKGYYQLDVLSCLWSFWNINVNSKDYNIKTLEFRTIPGKNFTADIHITDPTFIAGILENNSEPFVRIFPNPAFDQLHLRFNEPSQTAEITITNLHGEIVYVETITKESIDYTIPLNFPDGLYTIALRETNQLVFSDKLLVHKAF